MAEIKVNAAQVKAAADKLRALNKSFKSETENLVQSQQTLNGMWDGEANDKFNAAFSQDKGKMDQFHQAIERFASTLEQIAQNYDNAENRSTGIAGH